MVVPVFQTTRSASVRSRGTYYSTGKMRATFRKGFVCPIHALCLATASYILQVALLLVLGCALRSRTANAGTPTAPTTHTAPLGFSACEYTTRFMVLFPRAAARAAVHFIAGRATWRHHPRVVLRFTRRTHRGRQAVHI